MTKRFLGVASCLTLGLLASGCYSTKPDYAALLAEGHSRQVSLLIYATSWNSPRNLDSARMSVELINTQEKKIDSITLFVSGCGVKGTVEDAKPLVLAGPFLPGKPYLIRPSWPVNPADAFSNHDVLDDAAISEHMVIKSIETIDDDGVKRSYSNDINQFLTGNISNYCPDNNFSIH